MFHKEESYGISLKDWMDDIHTQDEKEKVFLNMDKAMKYLHSHGYCIQSFDPRKIEILNDSLDQIKFLELAPMPSDFSTQDKIIHEDIYNSAFIQIGLYSKCLNYLSREFLETEFSQFEMFLPESIIPYYRGVITRGSAVYLCEYDFERRKKDLATLEEEVGKLDGKKDNINKSRNDSFGAVDTNNRINDAIYRQLSSKESAFVSFTVYPALILALGFILIFIAFLLSF